jgi:UMF1 family MFS transporter
VFIASAVLFFIFALPCMLLVNDPPSGSKMIVEPHQFFYFKKSAEISNFLKATFFGLCGVNTLLLFMSVYATKAFGLGDADATNLILFASFFAIAGSIASGFISDRLGYRRFLILIFISWIACFLFGALADEMRLYRAVGGLAGLLLGATWVVARAFAVRLFPKEEIGGLFGLFNLAGYLSLIAGSLFWSAILFALYDLGALGYRIALLTMNIFTATGLVFLLRIRGHNELR